MNKTISDFIKNCQQTKICKKIDYTSELKCKNSNQSLWSMNIKGQFSITPLQIIIACGIICGGIIINDAVKKLSK